MILYLSITRAKIVIIVAIEYLYSVAQKAKSLYDAIMSLKPRLFVTSVSKTKMIHMQQQINLYTYTTILVYYLFYFIQ